MRVLFTLAAVLLVALVPPTARASHLKEQPKKHKIVYHLDEAGLDKARSVLGNIENHIRGVSDLEDTISRLNAYEEAGVTWWVENVWGSADDVRPRVSSGPPR